jgi:flagellar hook assembly protein FlgD
VTLVQGLTASPVVSPNGDGYADTATVSYKLTARSKVTATVTDATGAPVETLFSAQQQSARTISFAFSPGALPDGRYSLVVAAQADTGGSGSAAAAFAIDRTLGFVTVSPATVVAGSPVTASFALTAPGQTTVTVLGPDGSTVATLFAGELGTGSYSYPWNVTLPDGTPAPPGQYEVQVSVADFLGTVTQPASFQVTAASP